MAYYGGGYNAAPYGNGRKRGRDSEEYNSGFNPDSNYNRQRRRVDDSIAPYRGQDYSGYGQSNNAGFNGPRRGNYQGRRNKRSERDSEIPAMLSVGEKYCADLWRFGDEISASSSPEEGSRFPGLNTEDLEALKVETREIWSKLGQADVCRGFRIA